MPKVSVELFRRGLVCAVISSAFLMLTSCSKPASPPEAEAAKEKAAAPVAATVDEGPETPTGVSLPLSFGRRTGDLDDMAKHRNIRALVILNPVGFFYDKGHPRGAMYEALEEFQKFVNQKLKTGTLKITVTFIPVSGQSPATTQ